jgi:hypothetical protein
MDLLSELLLLLATPVELEASMFWLTAEVLEDMGSTSL